MEVITVRKFRQSTAALILGLAAATTLSSAGPSDAAAGTNHGVAPAGVWSASLGGVHGVAADAPVRQIARVPVAGAGIRVRLGNPFGASPVVIQEAWLGRPIAPGSARLAPGSNQRVTFHGARTVTIPPGREALSDPVPITVAAQQDVAVSLYAPGSPVDDHTFP